MRDVPLHPVRDTEHSKPFFRQLQCCVLQFPMHWQRITFNRYSGAGSKSIFLAAYGHLIDASPNPWDPVFLPPSKLGVDSRPSVSDILLSWMSEVVSVPGHCEHCWPLSPRTFWPSGHQGFLLDFHHTEQQERIPLLFLRHLPLIPFEPTSGYMTNSR